MNGALMNLLDVFGIRAAMFPDDVAGRCIDGLGDVAGIREIQHAVVHQRRAFLRAGLEAARPHQLQLAARWWW